MTALDRLLEEVEGDVARDAYSAFKFTSKLIAIVRRQAEAIDWYAMHQHLDFVDLPYDSEQVLLTHEKIGSKNIRYVESGRKARACNADVERLVKDE